MTSKILKLNSSLLIWLYSFVPNCRGGQIANFGEKNPQVHLIIIREHFIRPPPPPQQLGTK